MEKLLEPKKENISPEEEIEAIGGKIADLKLEMEKFPEHSHEWSVLHGKMTHFEHQIAQLEEKTWALNTQNGKRKPAA